MFCNTFSSTLRDPSSETLDRDVPPEIESRSFACDFLSRIDRVRSDDIVPCSARSTDSDCLRILDVGTGTGRIPIAICSRRRNLVFTAIDRSARALETAWRNVEQADLTNALQIVRADASSLPFENRAFRAVISNGLLHHVSDRPGVLAEMLRVLRPGGLLFVRDTLPGSDAGRIGQVLSSSSCAARDGQRVGDKKTAHAMLDIHQARDLALAAGLPHDCVRRSSPRHWVLEFRISAPSLFNCSRGSTRRPANQHPSEIHAPAHA
jgi:SAM-dependent methyltransferase